MPLVAGIYFIVNTHNGKVYVGSSKRPHNRWRRAHRQLLRGNRHLNQHLQRSWNKHGEAAFIFEVVEHCRVSELVDRERFYVNHLTKVGVPLYNGTTVINGRWSLPSEVKKKLRKANLGKVYPKEFGQKLSEIGLARYADPVEGPKLRAAISKVHRAKKMPESAKRKIRAYQLARYSDPETGKAARAAAGSAFKNKTRVHSPETCEKIRQTLLGRKFGKRSPGTGARISAGLKRHYRSKNR